MKKVGIFMSAKKDIHDDGKNKGEVIVIQKRVAKLNLKPIKPRRHPIED